MRLLTLGIGFSLLSVQTSIAATGAMTGAFSVDTGGAAHYAIPIVVPPGINGIEPHLTLEYSSSTGNGLLGVGWSLSGVSSIQRCSRTLGADASGQLTGERKGVSMDGMDSFCLDGQRLVVVKVNLGGVIEYKTESENWSKILGYPGDADPNYDYFGTTHKVPAYFKVWTKDFKVLQFGDVSTADAKDNSHFSATVKPPDRVGSTTKQAKREVIISWGLKSISDAHGNTMKITYVKSNASTLDGGAEQNLESIQYVESSTLSANKKVVFEYEARSDVVSRYIAGSKTAVSQRLAKISTYVSSRLVRAYSMIYEEKLSDTWLAAEKSPKRSYLTKVQECGAGGACLPATEFVWNQAKGGFAPWVAGASNVLAHGKVVTAYYTDGVFKSVQTTDTGGGFDKWNQLTDVDGDGYIDIVTVAGASLAIKKDKKSSTGVITDIYLQMDDPTYFCDVKVLYGAQAGTFKERSLATGAENTKIVNCTMSSFADRNQLVDVNADGVLDLVVAHNAALDATLGRSDYYTLDIQVYFGNQYGSGFTKAQNVTKQAMVGKIYFSSMLTSLSMIPMNQFIDINGDGRVDIFNAYTESGDYRVWQGMGDGTFKQVCPKWGYLSGALSINPCVDGSITSFSVDKNSTAGFRESNLLMDVNNDGLVDIVTRNQVIYGVASATQFGFVNPLLAVSYPYPAENGMGGNAGSYVGAAAFGQQMVDINADGYPDLLRAGQTEVKKVSSDPLATNVAVDKKSCSLSTFNGLLEVRPARGDNSVIGTGSDLPGFTDFTPNVVLTDNHQTQQTTTYYAYASCSLSLTGIDVTAWKGISHYAQFADVNGDGLVDVLRVNSANQLEVYLNKGNGDFFPSGVVPGLTLAATNYSTSFRDQNRLLDINGDGRIDLVKIENNIVYYALNQIELPSRIVSIIDGLGKYTSITYQPIKQVHVLASALDATVKDELVYPYRNTLPPMQVVTEHIVIEGDLGKSEVLEHVAQKYGGGYVDVLRGGFQFQVREQKNLQTYVRVYSTYFVDYPLRGMLKSVKRRFVCYTPFSTECPTEQFRNLSAFDQKFAVRWMSDGRYAITPLWERTREYADALSESRPPIRETTVSYESLNPSTDPFPLDSVGNPQRIVTTSATHWNGDTFSLLPLSYHVERVTTRDFSYVYVGEGVSTFIGHFSWRRVVEENKLENNTSVFTQTTAETFDSKTGRRNIIVQQPGEPLEKTVTFEYDSNGNLETESARGWDDDFDIEGNRTGASVRQRTIKYAYYGLDKEYSSIVKMALNTNKYGVKETTYYDNGLGVVLKKEDANNIGTTWKYDVFGRQIKEIRADGTYTDTSYIDCSGTGLNCLPRQWEWGRPATRLVVEKIDRASDGVEVNRSAVYYDAFIREVRSQTDGFEAGSYSFVDSLYQSGTQLTRKSVPHANASYQFTFDPATFMDTTFAWTYFHYDSSFERLLNIKHPRGHFTDFTYVGQRVTETTEGQLSSKLVNSFGKVTKAWDTNWKLTQLVYDARGLLTRIIDPKGNVIDYGYDLQGNRVSQRDGDLGLWNFRYNAFGDVRWMRDAKLQVTRFNYDVLGRKVRQVEPEGTAVWEYDTAANGIGRVAKVTAANGDTETYTYDAQGRQNSTTQKIDGETFAVTQTFDSAGRLSGLELPEKLQIKYGYRHFYPESAKVAGTGGMDWVVSTREPSGKITKETFGNDVQSVFGIDPETFVINAIQTGDTANPTGIQNLTYAYDRLLNLKLRADKIQNIEEVFGYDTYNRLTSVTGAEPLTLTYDDIGNITYKSNVGYYRYDSARPHAVTSIQAAPSSTVFPLAGDFQYDGRINGNDLSAAVKMIFSSAGTSPQQDCMLDYRVLVNDYLCVGNKIRAQANTASGQYRYDANGNMAGGTYQSIWSATYTSFNKPLKIQRGGATVDYRYDAAHARVAKNVVGTVASSVKYVGDVYEKRVESGVTKHVYYIPGGGRTVAIITLDVASETRSAQYVHPDHLGSMDSITDATKAVTHYSYDAFGKRRNPTWTAYANYTMPASTH
ncbi:MAG: FG-GAP-like repeat-containing protein, partial [Pseudomonadota bacterium]